MMRSAADRGAAHATASCAGASGAAFPKCGREGGDSLWFAASLRVDLRSLPCSRHSNRTFRFPRRPSASASHPSCSHRPRRGGGGAPTGALVSSIALARRDQPRLRGTDRPVATGTPSRRSVVAIFGRGPVLPPPAVAPEPMSTCPRQALRPDGRGPGPPALRFAPQSRDATPRSIVRIVSGGRPLRARMANLYYSFVP
jgi:hypothetical protein